MSSFQRGQLYSCIDCTIVMYASFFALGGGKGIIAKGSNGESLSMVCLADDLIDMALPFEPVLCYDHS